MAKIKIIPIDFLPKCPHCEKELEIIGIASTGALSATKLFVCPHCRKIIGPVYKA